MNKKVSILICLFVLSVLTSCNSVEQLKIFKEDNQGVESITEQHSQAFEQYGFYFNSLQSEQQKEIYEQIYNSLINKETEINIENINADTFKFLYMSVSLDNPNLFYVNNKYSYIPQKNSLVVYPEYSMTVAEQEKAQREIEVYINNILNQINDSMTPYEKEKMIYDYIASNTKYVTDGEYNQSMYSVVKGESVCLGYSKMFQYLCEKVGITCTIINGTNKEGDRHAWNCVYINENWYMVDCTNSVGQLTDEKDKISYHYFNITKEQVLRSYAIDNKIKTPECNSIEEEYYFKNGLYYNSVDTERIAEQIKRAINNRENTITIRCSSEEVLNGLYGWLIDERNIFNILNTQIDYVESNELLILQLGW